VKEGFTQHISPASLISPRSACAGYRRCATKASSITTIIATHSKTCELPRTVTRRPRRTQSTSGPCLRQSLRRIHGTAVTRGRDQSGTGPPRALSIRQYTYPVSICGRHLNQECWRHSVYIESLQCMCIPSHLCRTLSTCSAPAWIPWYVAAAAGPRAKPGRTRAVCPLSSTVQSKQSPHRWQTSPDWVASL
jgi:hypothetical protein